MSFSYTHDQINEPNFQILILDHLHQRQWRIHHVKRTQYNYDKETIFNSAAHDSESNNCVFIWIGFEGVAGIAVGIVELWIIGSFRFD